MRKNLITAIFLILLILLSGCSSDDNASSMSSIQTEQETASATQIQTELTEPSKETTIAKIQINMTDQEIIDLGVQKGEQLKKIYWEFLEIGQMKSELFDIDWDDIKEANLPGNPDDNHKYPFKRVISSKFKTYLELYDYFCTFCTSEYSTELLMHSRNIYRDIDDELYIFCGDGGFMGYIYSSVDSYKIVDNTIIYTCRARINPDLNPDYDPDNPPVHNPQSDSIFKFTIKQVDGEWYLDSCSDIHTLANTWYKEW